MCGDRSSSTPPLLYRRKSPGLTTNTSGPSSALKAVCSFGPPTYWEFGTNCRRTCASLFWFHWVTSRSNHSFWAALAPRGAKNCQKLSAALERSLVSGPHPGSAAAAAVAPSPLSTARRDGCEGLDDGGGGLTRRPSARPRLAARRSPRRRRPGAPAGRRAPRDGARRGCNSRRGRRSEEHTSELQSRGHHVCRPL